MSPKIKALSSGTLSQTLNLADFLFVFSPRHVDRRKRCQLSSTDDRHQFITLSVHISLQHNGCDAARRAGSSATAVDLYRHVYVGPPYCRAKMYAGRVAWYPLVSNGQYADGTDRQTDGHQAVALPFPL